MNLFNNILSLIFLYLKCNTVVIQKYAVKIFLQFFNSFNSSFNVSSNNLSSFVRFHIFLNRSHPKLDFLKFLWEIPGLDNNLKEISILCNVCNFNLIFIAKFDVNAISSPIHAHTDNDIPRVLTIVFCWPCVHWLWYCLVLVYCVIGTYKETVVITWPYWSSIEAVSAWWRYASRSLVACSATLSSVCRRDTLISPPWVAERRGLFGE